MQRLMMIMLMDYQSLTVVILVNTFGLLLVAMHMVKQVILYEAALGLILLHIQIPLYLLAGTIVVNQLLGNYDT